MYACLIIIICGIFYVDYTGIQWLNLVSIFFTFSFSCVYIPGTTEMVWWGIFLVLLLGYVNIPARCPTHNILIKTALSCVRQVCIACKLSFSTMNWSVQMSNVITGPFHNTAFNPWTSIFDIRSFMRLVAFVYWLLTSPHKNRAA